MDMDHQIVNFTVGNVRYGVPVEQVREVRDLQEVIPVPGSPHYVRGMSNLRGDLITVMDLQKRLALKDGDGDKNKIIIVEAEDTSVGVIVDTVTDVSIISGENVQSNMDIATQNEKHVIGVGKQEDELVVILDLYKVIRRVSDSLPTEIPA